MASSDLGRELAVRAAPAEAMALRGCVLTPSGPVEDGFVVIGTGHHVEAVQAQRQGSGSTRPTGSSCRA